MLKIIHTSSFKKDFKKIKKQNKNLDLLGETIRKLLSKEALEAKYRDHALIGNYIGKRECHIRPDWLLIYEINEKKKS